MAVLNINDEVEVTLTDYGRKILSDYYTSLGLKPHASEMSDKPVRIPLWDLMSKFGPFIYFGMPRMPFERNEIRLLPREG